MKTEGAKEVPPWRPSKRTLKLGLDWRKDLMRLKSKISLSIAT